MRSVAETKRSKFIASDYVGRNANEPSQASLHNYAVVNLPEVVKPDTKREETIESTVLAARSKMGWHA